MAGKPAPELVRLWFTNNQILSSSVGGQSQRQQQYGITVTTFGLEGITSLNSICNGDFVPYWSTTIGQLQLVNYYWSTQVKGQSCESKTSFCSKK